MGNCCYLFCSGNDSVNAGVQDPEERDERVKRASAYGTERLLSVLLLLLLREREQPQILAAADRSDITI